MPPGDASADGSIAAFGKRNFAVYDDFEYQRLCNVPLITSCRPPPPPFRLAKRQPHDTATGGGLSKLMISEDAGADPSVAGVGRIRASLLERSVLREEKDRTVFVSGDASLATWLLPRGIAILPIRGRIRMPLVSTKPIFRVFCFGGGNHRRTCLGEVDRPDATEGRFGRPSCPAALAGWGRLLPARIGGSSPRDAWLWEL